MMHEVASLRQSDLGSNPGIGTGQGTPAAPQGTAVPVRPPTEIIAIEEGLRSPTTRAQSVGVPPRPAPQPQLSSPSKVEPPKLDLSNRMTVTSFRPSVFLADAKKHADRTHPPTDHVPFKAYWTTYSNLSQSQANWYFYWRSQIRAGNALATDASYIYLHIYECLHVVGFDSAERAFLHLKWIWHTYRIQHPGLDVHLSRWLLDMIPYFGLAEDALQTLNPFLFEGVTYGERHVVRAAWLLDKQYERTSLPLVATLLSQNFRSGKFFQEFQELDVLESHFRKTLRLLDQFYEQNGHRGVLESIQLRRKKKLQGEAFSGAVFEMERRNVVVAEVPVFNESEQVNDLLSSVLKLSENILRRSVGFKGSKRGVELPPKLEKFLREHLEIQATTQTPPRRSIKIDFGLLGGIALESEGLRQMLEPIEASSAATPQSRSQRFTIPEATAPDQLTDVDRVADMLDSLDTPGLQALHKAMISTWRVLNDGDVEPSIRRINELARQFLNEDLLAHEGGHWIVVDDYLDELAFLLRLDEYQPKVPSRTESHFREGTDIWSRFSDRLTRSQKDVLKAILDGSSASDLRAIASSAGGMVSTLIDDINQLAYEFLDDTIIRAVDEELSIQDEYREHTGSLVY